MSEILAIFGGAMLILAAVLAYLLYRAILHTLVAEEKQADAEGDDRLTLEEYDLLRASLASDDPGQDWLDNQNTADLTAYLDAEAESTLAHALAARKEQRPHAALRKTTRK